MASFNRVIMAGNLTRDPQLRYLPSNMAVCDFGLASNRKWRDKDGNQHEEVCFVDCSAFGRQGETINQYMSKGKPILIEGRLKLEQWTAQDGSKRSKHAIVVENFTFLGGPRDSEGGGAPAAQGAAGRAYERAPGGGSGSGYGAPRGPAPQRRGPTAADAPAYDGGAQDGPPQDSDGPPPSGDDIPF